MLSYCLASAAQIPDAAQLEQSGAVIGQIIIDPQNIFDTDTPEENNGLYRLANRLHIKTQPHVIEQQLLFKSGDRFSQRLLIESERILRRNRFLFDASVTPVAYHDGKVDIAVVTRDVWTLNPGVSFGRRGGKNTYGFEIEEQNILGTGSELSLSRKTGIDRDTTLLRFRDPHLLGTWADLDVRYANNSDGYQRSFWLDRPFYALDTRWAAGVSALDDDRIESFYDLGQTVAQFRERQKFSQAYWGGSRGLDDGWARRWTTGLTYDERQFSAAPGGAAPTLLPEDRKLLYPWIGFELIQDDFARYRNHDQIGRTEDFYLGTRLSARLGWADSALGSDRSALLFSATAGRGFGQSESSTLIVSSSLNGRLENGTLRNTVLGADVRYYNRQSEQRLFFATLTTAAGHNLDLDNPILLGGDNGLRGYPLRYQGGQSSALLTMEERYFTNWYPLRLFRIGGAMFFDIGRTWGSTPVNTPSQGWLKDIGIGLRIGNSRSGLGNIIHVDLAFPLDGDPSISKVQLLLETKQRF
jgi:outer membrane protein assembly factor BamA